MTKVTDEMVNAAIKVYQTRAYKRMFESASAIPDPAGDMRAALEAALSRQGKVVAVEKLEALAKRWEGSAYKTAFPYDEVCDECAEDLRALIGEDHG